MDVTPQVINEVEFHQKMRGYDPDEVDDFLERVATAVGKLTERLHEAETRAAAADRRAFELERTAREIGGRPAASESGDADTETITRTLVLAQKTADAAVKDANDEAQRTLAEAHEKADVLVSEAQAKSYRLVSDAEIEARKTSEETRQRMADEIVALEGSRDALMTDHAVIERHLEEQRLRLRGAITDLQQLLDDPEKLRASALPELSVVARPSFSVAGTESTQDDEVIDLSESDETVEEENASDDDELIERPVSGGVRFTPAEDSNGGGAEPQGAHGPVVTQDDERDTDAWSRFVRQEMIDQPTAAVSMPVGEDAYLVELRKAMLDDSVSSDAGDHPSRTRFGRRR
jgi:DivIVA domain-containing protein